jgi:hypothetical protein
MWSKIKDNWNLIATVLIICVIFLWGKSCGTKEFKPEEPKIITITNYRDTIFPVDTFKVYDIKPGKPIHDTIYKPVYLDSTKCNKVFLYSDSIKTKEYDIYTKAYVQGLFRNLDLKVKLKVPLMIKDCTVVKKDSLIYRPYKYEIHAGGIIGFKTLIPVIEMSINKATYGAGYDILNKSIIFTAKYRLHGWTSKSKKKK